MTANQEMGQLTFDYSGAVGLQDGLQPSDFDGVEARLLEARDAVGRDLKLYDSGNDVPQDMQPLDAGFIEMPERILNEYESKRDQSELGRILATAEHLREQVDRVVILGIGGSYMGARALLDTCCEPYFNELTRAERGGTPRIYFEGNNVDNDHTRMLLKMLGDGRVARHLEDRWAVVVISKSGGTLETAVAFRQFLERLQGACGTDSQLLGELVVPVTGQSGKLADLADALGCRERFLVPDGVGGRFSVLSPVGLLPAAIMGLDVVALLRGAISMNERFRKQDYGQNPVLDYVAACHLLESKLGIDQRVMSVWSKSLETAGLWYDQLLAESLGKQEQGALPLTVVNTRDLHSRAQQHQEGKRDKVMINVILSHWVSDPLKVGMSDLNQDGLNEIGNKTLPEIMNAAIQGTNEAYREVERPTMDIHLPTTCEASLGQFFQMLMLATVVEGKLLGINPYGQPGVESYKRNMKRNLGMA